MSFNFQIKIKNIPEGNPMFFISYINDTYDDRVNLKIDKLYFIMSDSEKIQITIENYEDVTQNLKHCNIEQISVLVVKAIREKPDISMTKVNDIFNKSSSIDYDISYVESIIIPKLDLDLEAFRYVHALFQIPQLNIPEDYGEISTKNYYPIIKEIQTLIENQNKKQILLQELNYRAEENNKILEEKVNDLINKINIDEESNKNLINSNKQLNDKKTYFEKRVSYLDGEIDKMYESERLFKKKIVDYQNNFLSNLCSKEFENLDLESFQKDYVGEFYFNILCQAKNKFLELNEFRSKITEEIDTDFGIIEMILNSKTYTKFEKDMMTKLDLSGIKNITLEKKLEIFSLFLQNLLGIMD